MRTITMTVVAALLGCGSPSSPFDTSDDSGAPPARDAAGSDAAAQNPDGSTPTDDDGGAGSTSIGNYGPKDVPAFKTADDLCAYVNSKRMDYVPHDRFRGPPWVGEYHQTVTWPVTLTVDATLTATALALAKSLAGGASPQGTPYSDGQPAIHNYLYITGVDTSSYAIASQEHPGDWTSDIAGNYTAGITSANGTARMSMFYHDPGGQGPVLTRIGCGGAQSPGGASWWWVVEMGP